MRQNAVFCGNGLRKEHLRKEFFFKESSQPVQSQSTWSNVIKKLKIMAPYVWPKGSWWRQLIVLACLIILGAGRGINVLVPIYSKDIGNS